VGDHKISLHQWSYQLMQSRYMTDELTSLIWGLCFVAFWFCILAVLHKRNIIIRV
jgi:hypothetical protein